MVGACIHLLKRTDLIPHPPKILDKKMKHWWLCVCSHACSHTFAGDSASNCPLVLSCSFTRKLLVAIVDKWDSHVLVIDKIAPLNWKV